MTVLGPQEELGAQISCVCMSRTVFSFLMTISIRLPPIPPSTQLNIYQFLANQRVNDINSGLFLFYTGNKARGEFKNHKYCESLSLESRFRIDILQTFGKVGSGLSNNLREEIFRCGG